jgi:hypothetical protein
MKLLLLISLFNYNIIQEIREVLKLVESQGNEKIVGDNSTAFGILQIRPIAIREVNRNYKTHYHHYQMFTEKYSDEVFNLVMLRGVELYLKKYNRYPSEQDIVRMWNGGIYNGYRNNKTLKYYYKYLKYKDYVRQNQKINPAGDNDTLWENFQDYSSRRQYPRWENIFTSRLHISMHTLWGGNGVERTQMVSIGVYDRRRNYQNFIRSVQSSCGT